MPKNNTKRRDLLAMAVRRVFSERVAPAMKEPPKRSDKLKKGHPDTPTPRHPDTPTPRHPDTPN